MTPTDAELLAAARSDPGAFRVLYDRYAARVPVDEECARPVFVDGLRTREELLQALTDRKERV